MGTAHNATLPARKPRESNFELLRIVAMIFIVAHHFLIASGNINYYSPTLCGGEFAATIPATSRFINLHYAVHHIVPLFKDTNWFIPSYIGLMLLSPILNKALEHASSKELTVWTAAMTVLCLSSSFFSTPPVDTTGYNLIQFIYLYILGRFLKHIGNDINAPRAAAMYICGSLAAYAVSVLVKPGFTAFAYNSPQILIASSGLFLLFSKIKLRSNAVNIAASTTFCVFLFHYSIIYNLKNDCTLSQVILLFLVSFGMGFVIGRFASAILAKTGIIK